MHGLRRPAKRMVRAFDLELVESIGLVELAEYHFGFVRLVPVVGTDARPNQRRVFAAVPGARGAAGGRTARS